MLEKENLTRSRDEAQEQQLETAHRASLMRSHPRSVPCLEYGFRLANPATEAKDAIT
ncbi:hypothetical protein Plhal710r2_c003g0013161 [Plasmopara halstedii]